MTVQPALVTKFTRAATQRAVVCAPPTAVKSLLLKFLELLHTVDQDRHLANPAPGFKPPSWLPFMRQRPAAEDGVLESPPLICGTLGKWTCMFRETFGLL